MISKHCVIWGTTKKYGSHHGGLTISTASLIQPVRVQFGKPGLAPEDSVQHFELNKATPGTTGGKVDAPADFFPELI